MAPPIKHAKNETTLTNLCWFVPENGWNKTERRKTSPQKRHHMQVDQLESVGLGK